MQKISETARGRWHGILPQLGISANLLRNRHGPCPMCGGKDRFRFDDWDGKGVNIHRTYIENGKAVLRKLMPGKLPDNVAIRLFGFRDNSFLGAGLGTLGIAEGIETALSASALFDIPVWSAISAPLLKK